MLRTWVGAGPSSCSIFKLQSNQVGGVAGGLDGLKVFSSQNLVPSQEHGGECSQSYKGALNLMRERAGKEKEK